MRAGKPRIHYSLGQQRLQCSAERPQGRPTPAMTRPLSAARTESCTYTSYRMTIPHRHTSDALRKSLLKHQLSRDSSRGQPSDRLPSDCSFHVERMTEEQPGLSSVFSSIHRTRARRRAMAHPHWDHPHRCLAQGPDPEMVFLLPSAAGSDTLWLAASHSSTGVVHMCTGST